MIRHSMIVYRLDRAVKHAISFDGDLWLDYVPMRRPATTLISERLPPSAAGVLLNASHSYTDIYLPIDARQKTMFEAIDGVKSIRELAPDDASPIHRENFVRAIVGIRSGRLRHIRRYRSQPCLCVITLIEPECPSP